MGTVAAVDRQLGQGGLMRRRHDGVRYATVDEFLMFTGADRGVDRAWTRPCDLVWVVMS